jgi:DNA-binding CsgD family transcriptional regulator
VRALVGRDHELGELDVALDHLAGAEPWFVQISGEPGIGKSRLLAELCRRAEDRGCLVLEGRAAEFERDIPFGLIVDALNDYLASLEPAILRALDEDALSELGSILPSLPRPERSGSRPPGEGAERYRLHYAIRNVLERLTRRQPMVLALDDVHWADAGSVEVLSHLLRRFRGPLLLAVAYRQSPPRLLAQLEGTARAGVGTILALTPLSAEDAQSLIAREIDPVHRSRLYRESGGNPFYIEQLARSNSPRRRSHSSARDSSPEAAPRAVTAAIEEELLSISKPARMALRSAAVAGDPFEPELVAAIAEQDLTTVFAAFDELLELDFIRLTATPRRFRFRHPIVRRAVYDSTPGGWRIGAHARASAALDAAHAPASARAHHVETFATPGDEDAIAVLVQAAREATPRAPDAAGRWLIAATRLLPPDADEERRLSLLVEASSATLLAGSYDLALEILAEATGLLGSERAAERARLVARTAFARRMSGDPLKSRSLVAQTLEELDDDSVVALNLTLELALDHYWRGEFPQMHEVASHVLKKAHGRHANLLTSCGGALCSIASTALGRPAEALSELATGKTALAALPDAELVDHIEICGYLAQAASAVEQIDDALDCASRGLHLAQETNQGPYISGHLLLQANALVMKGRITEAAAAAETATDAAVLTGNDQFIVWALWADTMVCTSTGDTARALASAREALARSEHLTETFFSSLSRLHLSAALLATGDAAAARNELSAFEAGPNQRLLDLRGGHGWELLIRIQLALGELTAAAQAAETAVGRARATSLPQRTAAALLTKAAVLLAQNDAGGAWALADKAIELADGAGNAVLAARGRGVLGTALARAGEETRGIAELEGAERVLSSCGALREADAAARELRRLGYRGRRRARSTPSGMTIAALSPREQEVAALVAAGKRNRDVASALFVTEKTVESHLARIYDKLGVHSRLALAALVGSPSSASRPRSARSTAAPRAGDRGAGDW